MPSPADPPDATLLRQYRREPFGPSDLLSRRAAASDYAAAGVGPLGFLAFGKKKAAAPVLGAFGLSVDAASAATLRDFLDALRSRLDLRDALADAVPPTLRPDGFDDLDDPALLNTLRLNRALLAALAADAPADAKAEPDAELTAALTAALPEGARAATDPLGLTAAPADVRRAARFYTAVVAAAGLRSAWAKLLPAAEVPPLEALPHALRTLDGLLGILQSLAAAPPWHGRPARIPARPDEVAERGRDARATGPAGAADEQPGPLAAAVRGRSLPTLIDGLRRSGPRADALTSLAAALDASRLFSAEWKAAFDRLQRRRGEAADAIDAVADRLDTLEAVLRVRECLAALPTALAAAASALLAAEVEADAGLIALRRQTDAAEVRRRLDASPQLQSADSKRLRDAFDRYRALQGRKYAVVRAAILHDWTARQKGRLLAATGTRLNGVGADLRRRLAIRGKKLMRLRQMIRAGRDVPGGDPLLDACPVWMASPETVAQVFAREPLFDVVIFDEASQCRLEEALPMLTRGRRVVIAGDPKQLPPTRFFESALASSADEEPETEQELFEAQQSDTEDLLGAALGLDIQQCFLDVHYRSRNADLIGFSNAQFYGSRLQAIPGHPKNRTRYAPLRLYPVEGVYDERCNEAEAARVVQIVRDLLKWAEPPSVGIACFNLPQRDLILQRLDEAAAADPAFGARLVAARARRGEGSFEGLFVKNLENVQGDERDHMVISTTYGPSPAGKFRRSFGPVSQAGGGRRLNVLVTRARNEIHLVTSIPPAEYRTLPPIPEGQQPTGRYLLYAYLQYAERLAAVYAQAAAEEAAEVEGESADAGAADLAPTVRRRPTDRPSRFADALAERLLRDRAIGSDLYWGNEGFGIDLVLRRPAARVDPDDPRAADGNESGDVTVGLLCDLTRFAGTDDPVEWEAFRTRVHESQGWPLVRLWTPHAFRDPAAVLSAVAAAHAAVGRSGAAASAS